MDSKQEAEESGKRAEDQKGLRISPLKTEAEWRWDDNGQQGKKRR
jgi:hypothetical protein